MKLTPRPYQLEAIYSIFRYFTEHNGNPILAAPTGCHAKGHKILMANGETKRIEDVVVGDEVLGPDSKPRSVLKLARGRQAMRKITMSDGTAFTVNLDHKLSVCAVVHSQASKPFIITVRQFEEMDEEHKRTIRIRRVAAEFNNDYQTTDNMAYHDGLSLNEETVRPVGVVTSSVEHRLSYLAGIIDQCEPSCIVSSYTQSHSKLLIKTLSVKLFEHIKFLLHSLGFGVKVEILVTNIVEVYQITVRGDLNTIKSQKYNNLRFNPSFSSVGLMCRFKTAALKEDDYYGFTLSGDHLYLDASCIVHHNTGKSVIIGGFCEWVLERWPNQRILVVTHVKELVEQNHAKLQSIAPNLSIGINSAGLGQRDYYQPVIFCGIGSVAKSASRFGHIDLVIIDECHRVSHRENTQYRQFINELSLINPQMKVIGLTATPYTLGRGYMVEDEDNIFEDYCCDLTQTERFNEFFHEGYLTPVVPKATDLQLDTTGVKISGGEFVSGELQDAVNKDWITRKAIQEAIEKAGDRNSWLVFTTGIEHALDAAQILNEFGIPAAAIHSKLKSSERDQILADFKSGKLKAVTNNNVLTTGFDHPGIDLIIGLRPTKSVVLWVQMLGRGTRCLYAEGFDLNTTEGRLAAIANGGKRDCLVLDYAANSMSIGPINAPLVPQKGKGKGGGVAPVKECLRCRSYVPASTRFCQVENAHGEECGYEFIFETHLKEQASTAQLIKDDTPIIEEFEVKHMTYTRHRKSGAPDSIKISYHCNGAMFTQFMCLQHQGYAGRQARVLWRERTLIPAPTTTNDALALFPKLAIPTHLKVHTNLKYPQIMNVCYDGSNFGTKPPEQKAIQVEQTHEVRRNFKNGGSVKLADIKV